MTEIAARTGTGSGPVLSIAKAIGHLMTVHAGSSRSDGAVGSVWPMKASEAAAELEEAQNHLTQLNIPTAIMTEATVTAIQAWENGFRHLIAVYRDASPDIAIHTLSQTALRRHITGSWTLLALIDRELVGVAVNASDPGTRP